ncbi:unnamed protein product [Trichogramma brassicae]|uniref:Uncharacterized protein n=1 Tax=Trichogramma brassicae TaxID=86971 RepID=A0A6H5IZA2_9HYME|nr:unnamed protein product [Trichogramma brassicae]
MLGIAPIIRPAGGRIAPTRTGCGGGQYYGSSNLCVKDRCENTCATACGAARAARAAADDAWDRTGSFRQMPRFIYIVL